MLGSGAYVKSQWPAIEEQEMNTQIRELTTEETSLVGGGADPHWGFKFFSVKVQGNSDTGAWSVWFGKEFIGGGPE
jgi:hypothetical protein